MSDTVILALIAAIPPTIAAIAAVIIGIRNSGKLTEIHTLTNSNLSKVSTDLSTATEKISGLERLVSEMSNKKNDDDKNS